ncbi:hypothetical protein [Kitasatospora sp. NPDC094015]|uniref:hypothetical protein n=1 Tax=Kitasatospora sp. NPDC094015 TaxID=3155205 RepID=UPI003325AEF1
MNEFDRERSHRKAKDLSHLKDEVDEKNAEHLEQARRDQDDAPHPDDAPGTERPAGESPERGRSE